MNMAYVHSRCAGNAIDLFKTTEYFGSSTDVERLLDKLAANEVRVKDNYKFDALKEYLWRQTKPTVTLKFAELEVILGFKMPPQSSVSLQWWRRRWPNGISEAGYDTGYIVHRVDFRKKSVSFRRDNSMAATLKIPDVFLRGKIPADAATELTSFFEYVRNKYGF
jgi:hypothetical protein